MDFLESLFVFGLIAVLAGPVMALVALARLATTNKQIVSLQTEIKQLAMRLAGGDVKATVVQEIVAEAVTKIEPVELAKPVENVAAKAQSIPQASSNVWGRKSTAAAELQPVAHNVEQALASRWFVWVGGLAIALGGLLFVKYAHDNGLIPPVLRVFIGLGFAGALIVAGEWVRKQRGDGVNDYVPAALSAAGLVIGFGVVYAAYALYDLLSPAVCFPALVAIGLGALWLSRKQGPLIAALGLIGSYGAPALVPSEHPSAWGFFAFLIVIVAAALFELRNRPWWWLGFAAIGGAFAWAMLWIHGGLFLGEHVLPTGLFALALGAAATLIPRGKAILDADMGTLAEPKHIAPPMLVAIVGCAAGAVILAALVVVSSHALIPLLLFAVGMAALVGFGWLRDGMVVAPLAAAVLSFVVLMQWNDVGFHEWAMDERGFWSTVPGLFEPPRFRNAMLVALLAFKVIGLWCVYKKQQTLPWAALASGSALLFLFGAWARADFVWAWHYWAIVALALAIALTVVADRRHAVAARSAEVLLVGAALLCVFASDRALDGVWQTLAISVLAAAFALSTHRLALPWMGAIASGLASFAALRLFFGREFWGEPTGLPLGGHWVIYGYGIPAMLFWQASRWLKDNAFARWRVALEGLSLGLAISLVSLELRVLIGGGITTDNMGLLELSAHALAWLGAAYGLAYRQQLYSSLVSKWGARALLLASCAALFIGLTVRNPVLTGDSVEGGQVINALWLAYLAPVPLLTLMARKLAGLGLQRLRNGLGVFALLLLICFITLLVKRQFQGPVLYAEFLSQPESYATSLAWLVSGIGIFFAGLKLDRQNIRYGGLAILVLTVLKVFALDLFALGGLWRIASIIGLGACLIGVGWLYTRFIAKPIASAASERSAT